MANTDGQGHLLSLKVMRVSRPGLASAWEPFYSSSSAFSARSTASILSLQGKTPLPGHPKTLRDLTHVSEFLTLPVAFGAIQLGETFSSCLCVNNEANADVEGVSIKVEMQTANSKVLLAEVGGADCKLGARDTLEVVVHHEVKELGQHVLACSVEYRLPPGSRHAPGPAEGSSDPNLQGFRKFYKFTVSVANPLSVKTKVNTPRAPSALLDPLEREKVFLEVHIQNATQEPMWFERIVFECADGWTAADMNQIYDADPDQDMQLMSGSADLMYPNAVRQYIYVLSPTTIPTFPLPPQPGSTIPLGRLDISWRTQFGEPGRLVTSMLSRRIPAPPPPPSVVQQPASAIPPYLQRGRTPTSSPRTTTSQLPQSRPSSPSPHRPGSPFPNRPGPIARPQSPAGSVRNITQPAARPLVVPEQPADVEVDLVTMGNVPKAVHVYDPFTIGFKLTLSALIPRGTRQQTISIMVQHLLPPRVPAKATQDGHPVASDHALVASPSTQLMGQGNALLSLPPPYFDAADQTRDTKLKGCTFLGSSTISLESMRLDTPIEPGDTHPARSEGCREFELTFLPLCTGYVCVGGLRILLVEHELSDGVTSTHRIGKEPKTLKEYEVIGEVWVHS
ncbi:hypothetical protein ID866_9543 [Astraeus odoratus]|nr:hypothetical protein ID866_9543 [Astraeus odoratus]